MAVVPHDSPDVGAPLKFGGKANDIIPTPVQENDRTNAWFDRNGRQVVRVNQPKGSAVLHRNGVTTVDKISTPANPALAGVTVAGGSLVSGTTYYVAVYASNQYGGVMNTTIQNASPGGTNNALRVTINQVVGATHYDIFLTADATPKHVLRITESQRAAGGICTAAETYAAGGVAGAIYVGVIGASSSAISSSYPGNNAYIPANATGIVCTGYTRAHARVKLAVSDLRTVPTLRLVPFFKCNGDSAFYGCTAQTMVMLTGSGYPLYQDFWFDVDGADELVILIDSLTGQGAAATVWIELM
jgi:hypothetical protein